MKDVLKNPRFDPDSALGWSDIGLDGLSCYLRCVEAVLAAHGRSPREIALSLATPLDLTRSDNDRGPFGDFPGCLVKWQTLPDGMPVEQLAEFLRRNEFVVVSPNGYHWTGDEGEGQQRYHHHMVLPIEVDPGDVAVLDTDAGPDEFIRLLPVDGTTLPWADRIAPIELRPCPDERDVADRLLRGSASRLGADLGELAALRLRWQREPLPEMLARALHVYVLGEVQQQLFLFVEALTGAGLDPGDPLAEALRSAAARAKKLGILLTGLHRFRSRQAYYLCIEEYEAMERALGQVLVALEQHDPGEPAPVIEPRPPARLAARLAEIAEWSFGQPAEQTTAWILAPYDRP